MSGRRPWPTPEELRAVVAASFSLAEVLRRLGRPDSGGQRAALRRRITQERLDTVHFLGQAHNRGKPGTIPAKRPEEILVQHDGKRRTTTVLLRRALSSVGVPSSACGAASAPSGSASP